jgi:hypothetical protein
MNSELQFFMLHFTVLTVLCDAYKLLLSVIYSVLFVSLLLDLYILYILSRVWEWLQMRCGLDIGFINNLYTQLGIRSNYSATADLHNSQIGTAPAKSFPAYCVFTSHTLATASNSGDSSVSHAQVLSEWQLPSNCHFSSQTPVQNWLSTNWAPNLLVITSQHGPPGKQLFYCCGWQSHHLATGLYATV